jgi:hypothetical protein
MVGLPSCCFEPSGQSYTCWNFPKFDHFWTKCADALTGIVAPSSGPRYWNILGGCRSQGHTWPTVGERTAPDCRLLSYIAGLHVRLSEMVNCVVLVYDCYPPGPSIRHATDSLAIA